MISATNIRVSAFRIAYSYFKVITTTTLTQPSKGKAAKKEDGEAMNFVVTDYF